MADAPAAPQRPHAITQHGQTRIDEYYWMRYRDDPAVLDYLRAENDYREERLQHTLPLQARLYEELKGRIKEDDASVPERRGEYYYYTRYETGQQYPLYCRRRGALDAPEEVLLDQNALAAGRAFCRLAAYSVSPDHTKLAYSLDLDGSEQCLLYLKDLASGELYPETIANTSGNVYAHDGVEWATDSATLYYVTRDEALRPYKLFRHRLGTDTAQDELLYHEADETYFLFVYKTRSQAYITVFSMSTLTTEWRLIPADRPLAAPRLFQARRHGIEYHIEHHGERFFVLTNEDALNFKLMETPADATGCEHWREVIPHRPDVLILSVDAFARHLVLLERQGGLRQIRISAPDGVTGVRYVPFPELAYTADLSANPEFDTPVLRFYYSSLITPNSTIDYDMETGTWMLRKQQEVPSGHDPAGYTMERLQATAPDGAQVPVTLAYKKGLAKDGDNPAVLFGYGSYGYSYDPYFNPNLFSLIDRGFVVGIAHIRGGMELGRAWYEAGRLLQKRNSFTDFIAVAEHLIAQGYTRPERLGIYGVSAGGLLVGACLTMRPDLFGAVVAKVPFVDAVTTMSDPTIPLTTLEYDQWGNPDNAEYFHYMLSYSPYDNLRPTTYPHVFITTGLNDPRVAYWEPAKFAARLRARKTDDHLVVLRANLDAGHAGASGRYDNLREFAEEYAFLIDRLGRGNW
jgi:oligopeptidase B